MVGPAPERHMPSKPGCEAGVIKDVTAGRPGIWRKEVKMRIPHGMEDSTYKSFSIWLMHAILHSLEN
jgi:hypothetical protein